MPLSIPAVVPSARSLRRGYTVAAASGLKYWGFLGRDEQATTRNFAPGGSDATIVGNVQFQPGYASFPLGAYLQTNVAETKAMTILAIARSATAPDTPGGNGNAYIVSNNVDPVYRNTPTSPETVGVSLYWNENPGVRRITLRTARVPDAGTLTGDSQDSFIASPPLVTSNWGRIWARAGDTFQQIAHVTQNELPNAANASRLRKPNSNTFRIGKTYNGFGGPVDIFWVAIYDRDLTADERAVVLAQAQYEAAQIAGLAV